MNREIAWEELRQSLLKTARKNEMEPGGPRIPCLSVNDALRSFGRYEQIKEGRIWSAILSGLSIYRGEMEKAVSAKSHEMARAHESTLARKLASCIMNEVFSESHNATPEQHETATDAEKHNETDS